MVGTFPSFLYNLEVIDAIVNRTLTIYPQLRERTDAFQCGKSGYRHGDVWLLVFESLLSPALES